MSRIKRATRRVLVDIAPPLVTMTAIFVFCTCPMWIPKVFPGVNDTNRRTQEIDEQVKEVANQYEETARAQQAADDNPDSHGRVQADRH